MKISVLTPTYNRGNLLNNLYQSLIENLKYNVEIEWLIMDDGSTDETKVIVSKMQEELLKNEKNVQYRADSNKIERKSKSSGGQLQIKYFYQENQGKMTAINNLVEKAVGDLIVECDSDDKFSSNAFEIIKNAYEENKENLKDVYAFCFLKYDTKGNNMGKDFAKNKTTMFDLYFKEGENGEKALAFITKIRKQYKHKLEHGEKFVTEARLYHEMDLNYKMICINEPIMICEYQENGYTKNISKQFKENPYGYFEYFREILSQNMNRVKLNKRLYAIKHYILFGYLTGKSSGKDVKGALNKILYYLMYIPRKDKVKKILVKRLKYSKHLYILRKEEQ